MTHYFGNRFEPFIRDGAVGGTQAQRGRRAGAAARGHGHAGSSCHRWGQYFSIPNLKQISTGLIAIQAMRAQRIGTTVEEGAACS